ncbi:MAG: hypothetical protein ABIH72_04345, partial [archaeon]
KMAAPPTNSKDIAIAMIEFYQQKDEEGLKNLVSDLEELATKELKEGHASFPLREIKARNIKHLDRVACIADEYKGMKEMYEQGKLPNPDPWDAAVSEAYIFIDTDPDEDFPVRAFFRKATDYDKFTR